MQHTPAPASSRAVHPETHARIKRLPPFVLLLACSGVMAGGNARWAENELVTARANAADAPVQEKGAAAAPIKTLGGIHFSPTHADLKPRIYGLGIYVTAEMNFGLQAPLDLPAGTIINSIDFHVVDNDPSLDIDLSIRAGDPALDNDAEIGTVTTSSAWAGVVRQTIFMMPPLVVDPDKSYRLRAVLRAPNINHRLIGVKVHGVSPEAFSDGFEASKSLLTRLGILPVHESDAEAK